MKWSELDRRTPPASAATQWVEDRVLDFFAERLDSDCPIVTEDSRIGEDLGLRGRQVELLFAFLDSEFGFRATDSERREILSSRSTVGDLIRLMRAFVERRPGGSHRAAVPASTNVRIDATRPELLQSPVSQPAREPRCETARDPIREAARDHNPSLRYIAAADSSESKSVEPSKSPMPPTAEPKKSSETSQALSTNRAPSAPTVVHLRPRTVSLDGIAFTQKRGDPPTHEQWRSGPLYEPYGKTREGTAQFLRTTDGMRCVLIPAAEAVIGSDTDTAHPERGPAHTVKLSRFLMDAEPVSAAAYARFLNAVGTLPDSVLLEWIGASDRDSANVFHPLRRSWLGRWSAEPGTEMQPMTLVSWYGANAYSLWAHRWDWRYYNGTGTIPDELTVYRFTGGEPLVPSERDLYSCLPTEAQWEYAARGAQPRRWPWGEAEPTLDRVCLLRLGPPPERFGESEPPLPADAMVNIRLGVSPFGLHHMAGHVRQWCRDYYHPRFYATPAARRTDPANRESSETRSERGGSGTTPLPLSASAPPGNPLDLLPPSSHRRGRLPHSRGRLLGFRCVGSPDEL